MRAIWKFRIMGEDGMQAGPITMPSGAIPRHVAMQDGFLCLWVEVDGSNPLVDREFIVVGTGHPIPDSTSYVGTTQDGQFVWHLYEIFKSSAAGSAPHPPGSAAGPATASTPLAAGTGAQTSGPVTVDPPSPVTGPAETGAT